MATATAAAPLLAVDQGWAVAGLSSYQDKNGHALGTYGVLEVYTRVSAHTDWIERGLNGQLDADDPKGCSASGMRQTNGAGWFLFLPLWIVWRKSQGRTHEPWVVNKTHFGYHDPCAFWSSLIVGLGYWPTVHAMPLHPERNYGGPHLGAAWSNPASTLTNPAALPARKRTPIAHRRTALARLAKCRNHRYAGIDPNTQAPYATATSHESYPGGFIGLTWPLAKERITLGLSVATPVQSSRDFESDRTDECIHTPTRYAVIDWHSQRLQISPAVRVETIQGVHVGGGWTLSRDDITFSQAWDPLGTEGMGPGQDQPGFVVPFSNDVILDATLNGSHQEWNGGIWIERFPVINLGLSYTHRQALSLSGNGHASFPQMMGGVDVETVMGFEQPLANEWRIGLSTKADALVRSSLSASLENWQNCCSERSGDILQTLTAPDGGPLGPEQGIIIEISEEFYLPQRLSNSVHLHAGLSTHVLPSLSVGLHAARQTPSVPDYALNALHQDFLTRELGFHALLEHWEKVHIGMSYVRRNARERLIVNSAWDVRSITAEDLLEDYVDERFSPQLPYVASGNGQYAHSAQMLSLRIELIL